MASIEEANRHALTAIDEAVGWVPPKREAEHVERILAAHIAVCDLALAGFELGSGLTACNSSACSTPPLGSTGWRCKYCDGRVRIAALGK